MMEKLHPEKPMAAADENLSALLAFRIDAGETILEKHLLIAEKNAIYISNKNQNELIGICGDVISDQMIADIRQAKYFSVLADETTDSGHREQLCMCLRFVSQIDGKHSIREKFIQFQAATNFTGDGPAESIVTILEGNNLNFT